MNIKEEASVSTLLVNLDNKFDPFEAMSTPLYQTATFKQVLSRKSNNLVYYGKILSLDASFFAYCSLLLLKMDLMIIQEVEILHGMHWKGNCFLASSRFLGDLAIFVCVFVKHYFLFVC